MTTWMQTKPTITKDYVEQLPENVIRAMRALLALSLEERAELLKLNELVSGPDQVHPNVRDLIINVQTGPWGDICPFCGRSS